MNPERGSATVSMAAIALAMVVMASVGYGLASAVLSQRQVTIATDSAALAAADVRVGVRPGVPCTIARDVLDLAGVALVVCDELADSVVVEGRKPHGPFDLRATARAGVVDSGGK